MQNRRLQIVDSALERIRLLESRLLMTQFASWQIKTIHQKCYQIEKDPISCATLCLAEYNGETYYLSLDQDAAYYYSLTEDTIFLNDVSFHRLDEDASPLLPKRFSLPEQAIDALKSRLQERGDDAENLLVSDLSVDFEYLRIAEVGKDLLLSSSTLEFRTTLKRDRLVICLALFVAYDVTCGGVNSNTAQRSNSCTVSRVEEFLCGA